MYLEKINILINNYESLKRIDKYNLSINLGQTWVYKNQYQ